MRAAVLALALSGCALAHEAPADAASDAGRCLLDVPCWCVVHHPIDAAPFANCRHTEAECLVLEGPGDEPCRVSP